MGTMRIMSCKFESIVKSEGQRFFSTNHTCVMSSCLKACQPLHPRGGL